MLESEVEAILINEYGYNRLESFNSGVYRGHIYNIQRFLIFLLGGI